MNTQIGLCEPGWTVAEHQPSLKTGCVIELHTITTKDTSTKLTVNRNSRQSNTIAQQSPRVEYEFPKVF